MYIGICETINELPRKSTADLKNLRPFIQKRFALMEIEKILIKAIIIRCAAIIYNDYKAMVKKMNDGPDPSGFRHTQQPQRIFASDLALTNGARRWKFENVIENLLVGDFPDNEFYLAKLKIEVKEEIEFSD